MQPSLTLADGKLYEELLTKIDQGMNSCGTFSDLSKAFHTVNHDILLQKLKIFFGIRGKAQNILENYLIDRYQSRANPGGPRCHAPPLTIMF